MNPERRAVRTPTTALDERYSDPDAAPTPWTQTEALLARAELAMLTTVRRDGRPHQTPVVPVWVDDALYFTTGATEQKAANLRANPHVLLTVGEGDWKGGVDVVLEGEAALIRDRALLVPVAARFADRWDGRWTYDVADDGLRHPAGFSVLTYGVQPRTVYAFAEGLFGHTVHRF